MDFIDLKTQYSSLKTQIDKRILEVCTKAQFINGPQVKELETALAEYVGVKHCVSCGNGTDALTLAMMAYGVGVGDAVFVPTFTFYASAEIVSFCGATPIFVDIDLDTFNISPSDLKQAVETVENGEIKSEQGERLKPRAVIAVDLFGLPADFKAIQSVAEEHNLLVVEDGAQGFGGVHTETQPDGSVNKQRACSFGDIATTSFFPAKPLGCYGDGGAVFTNEDKVCDYLESLRVHGKGDDKYDNVRIGMNSRLDTIQAAVLLEKLDAFDKYELEARQRVKRKYDEMLSGYLKVPTIPDESISSYAQYSVLFENREMRDSVQLGLKEAGIPTMIYYTKSMHQQTVYRNNPSIYRSFPNAESASERILCLPMHPYLKDEEIMIISRKILELLNLYK